MECSLAFENNQYSNSFRVNMDARKYVEKRLWKGEMIIRHRFSAANLFTVGLTCPSSANYQYNIKIICAE